MRRYFVVDARNLSKAKRTPQGGLRVDANLTRTGIFEYRNPDGSVRREYRPQEEVFSQDALDSFRGVPVTVGHPGAVTADNWREHSVGHVGDSVRADGNFARAEVIVQDAATVKSIERGDLAELSCGYDVDIDPTAGDFEGQRYDCIQRNMRGNHVALLPVGRGRAGNEVALRLDSNGDEIDYTRTTMPDDVVKPAETTTKIKTDKIEVRVDGQADIDHLQAECDTLRADKDTIQSRFDAAVKSIPGLVAERVSLVLQAQEVLGKEFKHDGLSTREIQEAVIKAKRPEMKLDGKSIDYVSAAFEMAFGVADTTPPHESLSGVRRSVQDATEAKDGTKKISDAESRNREASQNAWKSPLSTSRAS